MCKLIKVPTQGRQELLMIINPLAITDFGPKKGILQLTIGNIF